MLRDSHLAETADRHGFIVVAPNGGIAAERGYLWNIPGVPTVTGARPSKDARDDVAYILGLVNRLVATGCVDSRRVYVTGLSGGGRMTSLLGCVASRRFAAIAPVVGLRAGRPLASDPSRVDPKTCRARAPLPVLAFRYGRHDQPDPGWRRALLAVFSGHSPAALGGVEQLHRAIRARHQRECVRTRLQPVPQRQNRGCACHTRRAAQLVSRGQRGDVGVPVAAPPLTRSSGGAALAEVNLSGPQHCQRWIKLAPEMFSHATP